MKKYRVLVSTYPKEIIVEASSTDEARRIAKDKVDFSVYSMEVQVI